MPGPRPAGQTADPASALRPGENPDAAAPNSSASLGIGLENFMSVFLMHRHDGSAAGGGALYGPYFLKDTVSQKLYKLVVTNGVLGVVKAF